jgi:hypothetical protein
VGGQDRRRLPLCAGGSRVRARLYALIKAIRERRRKALRVRRSPTIACASVLSQALQNLR